MDRIDYLQISDDVMDFADHTHAQMQKFFHLGLMARFIPDDFLDTIYDYYWVVDYAKLNHFKFVISVSCLYQILRTYGNDVVIEDEDYLQPLRLNIDQYPLNLICSHMDNESSALFVSHYTMVCEKFSA